MTPECLELEIEICHGRLTKFPGDWLVYLRPDNRLARCTDEVKGRGWIAVGRYNRRVSLYDFRDDVFWTYDQRGKGNGR